VIAEHRAALAGFFDALAWEDETAAGTQEDEDVRAAIDTGNDRADAATHALLTAQPTTLAGVAALLEHVGHEEFLDMSSMESEDTILTAWTGNNISNDERREIAQDFPLRLAATMRSILGSGQS